MPIYSILMRDVIIGFCSGFFPLGLPQDQEEMAISRISGISFFSFLPDLVTVSSASGHPQDMKT
jgi:hypothetical protein